MSSKERKRRAHRRRGWFLSSKEQRGSLSLILLFVGCLFCALFARLIYLQIFRSDDLTRRALSEMTHSQSLDSTRGLILDRNHRKLAMNVSASDIYVTPASYREKKSEAQKTQTIEALSELLNMAPEKIEEALNSQKEEVRLARQVDRETSFELEKLGLPGIRVKDRSRRFYPFNSLASHVIGFVDDEGRGLYGVEASYNEELTGYTGRLTGIWGAAGLQNPFDEEERLAPKGGVNLALTIDETIQRFAEDAASKVKEEQKARKVSILIQDPNTGEFLAMVNKDDYNLNLPRQPQTPEQKRDWENLTDEQRSAIWFENWRNFAVNDVYEPGSTFKTITAAAALEEATSSPDEHFYCTGYIRDIKGAILKCDSLPNPYGDITMKSAYAKSCNTSFVKIGRSLGREKFLTYIRAFGFGEKTGIDLPGEATGIIPTSPKEMSELRLATMSYGHGIAVTPVQLINAVSATVNGGKLMVPRVVHEIVSDDMTSLKVFSPEVKRQVISRETSEMMRSFMEETVLSGTGGKAKVPGYRIGGKTGTANLVSKKGGYEEDRYVSSFVGVAPIDHPKFVVLVIVEDPQGGYYGGSIAAPVAGDLFKKILQYKNIPRTEKVEEEIAGPKVIVPDVTNRLIEDAGKILVDKGLQFNAEFQQGSDFTVVTRQEPKAGTEVDAGSIIDLYLNPNNSNAKVMPILTGKTAEEVKEILDPLEVDYELQGTGEVTAQSPKPGSVISWKDPIVVTLQPPLYERNDQQQEEPSTTSAEGEPQDDATSQEEHEHHHHEEDKKES